jgi:hypothetical protein
MFETPTLDEYWRVLASHLRRLSPDEQRAAVALYRELAKGQAVDAAQLGQALGVPAAEGRALLQRDSINARSIPTTKGARSASAD